VSGSATRPFVDVPVADLAAASKLAQRVALQHDLGEPVLIRRGMNALFRAGDLVIRVGQPSTDPALGIALVRRLAELGVPVVPPASELVVERDGLSATLWPHLPDSDAPIDWFAVGNAVRSVHRLDRAELPDGYPVPTPARFPWWDFDDLLAELQPDLDIAASTGLRAAVERHRGWATMTAPVVCHGDVHPGNVMMTPEGPRLIDWDLMCTASPGWDHGMLLTLADRWGGGRAVYAEFARGYGRSFEHDDAACGFAELRNVAATLMRVRAARTDVSARGEAERRLRYWRGDSDAPEWRAQ
jgi:aminoglycoside phosphotransferase (APT) family kinase protein